jgi:hypothetical protein
MIPRVVTVCIAVLCTIHPLAFPLGPVAMSLPHQAQRGTHAMPVHATLEAELATTKHDATCRRVRLGGRRFAVLAKPAVLLPLVVHRLREVHLDAPVAIRTVSALQMLATLLPKTLFM